MSALRLGSVLLLREDSNLCVLPGELFFFVRMPGEQNYGSSLAHFHACLLAFSDGMAIPHSVPLKPPG